MTAEELARRLITLIFAGRNRRDMIRRELPRTRRAGLGRSRFRIEHEEGSPHRVVWLGGFHERLLLFAFQGNGPDESL